VILSKFGVEQETTCPLRVPNFMVVGAMVWGTSPPNQHNWDFLC